MFKDFVFLDENLRELSSVVRIFGFVDIGASEAERMANDVENSYKTGSTAISAVRIGTQSITFSNPLKMSMEEYNDTAGLLENTRYIGYEGQNKAYNGYQKCSLTGVTMAWGVGSFEIGGTLTITVKLLSPFFENYEQYAIRPTYQNTPSLQHFVPVEVPFRDSSFYIRVQAEEPNQGFRLSISNSGRFISFSDLSGFGRSYFSVDIDTRDSTIKAIAPDGKVTDVGNLVTGGAPFMIPRGQWLVEIQSVGEVRIDNFYIRRRWGV